ncbi:MAG: hypothetical protein RLZZ299_1282 [Pseudomonadota bacterium]
MTGWMTAGWMSVAMACATRVPGAEGDTPSATPPPEPAAWEAVGVGDASDPFSWPEVPEPLRIRLSSADWSTMRAEAEALVDAPGAFAPGVADAVAQRPTEFRGDLWFRGQVLRDAGVRLKGNATLQAAVRAGSWKLPLRIDAEAFTDRFPGNRGRRWHGMEQISLANGARDPSGLRDFATARWFAAFGIAAPRVRRVDVTLELDADTVRLGVYTLAEVPGAALLAARFGSPDGSLYEADGPAASLDTPDPDAMAAAFKPQRPGSDGEDLARAIARLADPAQDPDAAWDTEGFLGWLAANTSLQNWDAYGAIAHNYYLSGDAAGRMRWIPWDFNEAMRAHDLAPPLDLRTIAPRWRLIRRLLDTPAGRARYRADVHDFDAQILTGAADDLRRWHAAARDAVVREDPAHALHAPGDHDAALTALTAWIDDRRSLVATLPD